MSVFHDIGQVTLYLAMAVRRVGSQKFLEAV